MARHILLDMQQITSELQETLSGPEQLTVHLCEGTIPDRESMHTLREEIMKREGVVHGLSLSLKGILNCSQVLSRLRIQTLAEGELKP